MSAAAPSPKTNTQSVDENSHTLGTTFQSKNSTDTLTVLLVEDPFCHASKPSLQSKRMNAQSHAEMQEKAPAGTTESTVGHIRYHHRPLVSAANTRDQPVRLDGRLRHMQSGRDVPQERSELHVKIVPQHLDTDVPYCQ